MSADLPERAGRPGRGLCGGVQGEPAHAEEGRGIESGMHCYFYQRATVFGQVWGGLWAGDQQAQEGVRGHGL